MTNLDPRDLRTAFGSFMTGVTVVTALDADGTPFGFTANSFSSVSLDPPLLLVCPGRFLSSFLVFEACSHFAISVLAEGQEDVSNTFARFKGDRFAQVETQTDQNSVPFVAGAAARFSCKTAQVVPAGDHIVLMGQVQEFECSGKPGLGYANGQYFSLGLERAASATDKTGLRSVAGAIIERDGQVLLQDTPHGLAPPQLDVQGRAGVRDSLGAHLNGLGLNIMLDRAYSVFDDQSAGVHYTYFLARAEDDTTPASARYVPITDLPNQTFCSPAHASMLTRFALEHQTQSFGLYVGDEHGGDIHR
ncbi:MAG: flavin reductase [Rhodobacteraceae bacterium]|nr:flavin reductase [Paracoccaceae bacterium]